MTQKATFSAAEIPAWRAAGHRYHSYNFFLRQKFGQRVQHCSIDAGFTCPNVDGTVAIGGCVFCDNRSFSPSRRGPRTKILAQIDDSIRRIQLRYKVQKFLAYFQPATNTYGSVEKLERVYREALSHPAIVGLVIGTRPDCVPDPVLDLIEGFAREHYVTVEYGLQTMHDRSLDWMNRGHHYDAFVDAMHRSRGRGFEIGVHLILGIPGETHADAMASVEAVSQFDLQAIKLHNLYAVEGTPLGEWVKSGQIALADRATYVNMLVDALERLPPHVVVERTSGEAPPKYLIGPTWCLDKPGLKTAIEAEMQRRDSWQGKLFEPRQNEANQHAGDRVRSPADADAPVSLVYPRQRG